MRHAGNLDQETGGQIMDLLFALKREDLVMESAEEVAS